MSDNQVILFFRREKSRKIWVVIEARKRKGVLGNSLVELDYKHVTLFDHWATYFELIYVPNCKSMMWKVWWTNDWSLRFMRYSLLIGISRLRFDWIVSFISVCRAYVWPLVFAFHKIATVHFHCNFPNHVNNNKFRISSKSETKVLPMWFVFKDF